jgi:hypothetical protein
MIWIVKNITMTLLILTEVGYLVRFHSAYKHCQATSPAAVAPAHLDTPLPPHFRSLPYACSMVHTRCSITSCHKASRLLVHRMLLPDDDSAVGVSLGHMPTRRPCMAGVSLSRSHSTPLTTTAYKTYHTIGTL